MNDMTVWNPADDSSMNFTWTAGSTSYSGNIPLLPYNPEGSAEYINAEFSSSVPENDKLDYAVAAASGIISAVIDELWVGPLTKQAAVPSKLFQPTKGKNILKKTVEIAAISQGYSLKDVIFKDSEDEKKELEKQIRYILSKHPIPDDVLEKYLSISTEETVELADLPSVTGLVFSTVTRLCGYKIIIKRDNTVTFREYSENDPSRGSDKAEQIIYGTVHWLMNVVYLYGNLIYSEDYLEKEGLPEPVVSLIKQIAEVKFVKDLLADPYQYEQTVSKGLIHLLTAYILNPLKKMSSGDKESVYNVLINMGKGLAKQAVPVAVNECIVRSFYFVRHLYMLMGKNCIMSFADLQKSDLEKCSPFNNEAVNRMLVISSGVFTVLDAAGAAVHGIKKGEKVTGFVEFAANINYVGVIRFAFACRASADDIRKALESAFSGKSSIKEKSQNDKDDLKYQAKSLQAYSLNAEQSRILYSLEAQKTVFDIEKTKNRTQRETKLKWLREWKKLIEENQQFAGEYFINDEYRIYDEIHKSQSEQSSKKNAWLYIVSLELFLFSPYICLGKDKEADKKYKTLHFENDYSKERFAVLQNVVSEKEQKALIKKYNHYVSIISGSVSGTVKKLLTTAAVAVASGGTAFAFAPVIAVGLLGSSFAGLSGAALTSASLAALGGGSIATGGLGMAGGTAIISGAGAVIGAASTSVSLHTIMMLSSKEFTLKECAKLLALTDNVILNKYNAVDYAKRIDAAVASDSYDMDKDINQVRLSITEKDKKVKKQLSDMKESGRYIERTSEQINKIIEEYEDPHQDPDLIDIFDTLHNFVTTSKDLANVFKDTGKQYLDDPVLKDSVQYSIDKQLCIREDDFISDYSYQHVKEEPAAVTVSQKRTIEAAEAYSVKHICILNFANPEKPGGGVKDGTSGQEEDLCRCSTLYFCLRNDNLINDFYNVHAELDTPLATNDCIYTPNVIIFKNSKYENVNPENWIKADIISCSAPDLSKAKITDSKLSLIHEERLKRIYNIAADHKADVVILGAFGCGTFNNDPEVVAKAMKKVTAQYLYVFDAIEFAIPSQRKFKDNYPLFSKIINNR